MKPPPHISFENFCYALNTDMGIEANYTHSVELKHRRPLLRRSGTAIRATAATKPMNKQTNTSEWANKCMVTRNKPINKQTNRQSAKHSVSQPHQQPHTYYNCSA